MKKPPTYIEASDIELDCGIKVSDTEWVRGFLRLPTLDDPGRIRFVEDIPALATSPDGRDPLQIFLLDGSVGTPACLLSYFLGSHRLRVPTPAAFPLELVVNRVIIGTDDATEVYDRATLRCEELLEIFESSTLPAERVVQAGSCTEDRLVADGDDMLLTVAETARMDLGEASGTIHWSGELRMEGSPRTLEDWTSSLASTLLLFAVLVDRPLKPDRICANDHARQVDLYASWSTRSAPPRTSPLIRSRHIESRFGDIFNRWCEFLTHAQEFVDHVGEYQLFRDRLTLGERVLLLFRCLELYHDSSDRFDSVIRPKSVHRQLVDAAVAALPGDMAAEHSTWIEAALRGANHKRLVDQVGDILNDLGPAVCESCRIGDIQQFASLAKSARNYFTHPTGPPPPGIPAGRELLILIHQLWFVVRASLLVTLGFSNDEAAAALRRSAERHYFFK